jgi:lipoprotein-releasing system permease protein
MMFLSLRHLLSRKKQSLLILAGIVIGTAAFVAFSGIMLGFQNKLLDQLVNNEAHIKISAKEELLTAQNMAAYPSAAHVFWLTAPSGRKDSVRIEFPVAWFERLERSPEVVAFSPQLSSPVLFKRGVVTKSGRMIGSDPTRQILVTNIESYMIDGEFAKIGNSGNRIVIGRDLQQSLGANINETLFIRSGEGASRPFKIIGIFQTGIKSIDESTAFASLADTQQLAGTPSIISEISVRIRDPYSAPKLAKQWIAGSPEKVISWQEASASILSVFKTQDVVRYSVTFAIILVAGFGIFNILSILVSQKRRDIAILRSMGFLPKDIVSLFFNQGLILGVLGGLLGLGLGYVLCLGIGSIKVASGRVESAQGTMLISYESFIYWRAFLLAIVSSVISSIIPAREAGSLDPMDIIRTGGQ